MNTHLDGKPMNINKLHIILASNSPRRRELLQMICNNVEIAASREVEEIYPHDLPAEDVPGFLSKLKADAFRDLAVGDSVVVTADTVVIVGDRILGKPADYAEAKAMLQALSGRAHKVVTGVTITASAGSETFSETTEVNFRQLTDDEIDHYITRYKPYDKAGAYGIQEWIGCIGIESIRGCYYNVMGLPLHSLYKHLSDCDFMSKFAE
jgi:septum formation protein